jgi:dihydroorotase
LALKWQQQDALPLVRALGVVSAEPARVLGGALGTMQASCGKLVEGGEADVCVFDPQAHWTVSSESLRSQGKHTPFSGYELPGRVRCTIVGGQIAFEARAGTPA